MHGSCARATRPLVACHVRESLAMSDRFTTPEPHDSIHYSHIRNLMHEISVERVWTCSGPQQCKGDALRHSNAHQFVTCCGDALVSRWSRPVKSAYQPQQRDNFFFRVCLILGHPCSSGPAEVGRLRGLSSLFSCRLGGLYLYCFSVFLRGLHLYS